jgi:hypothetical protein
MRNIRQHDQLRLLLEYRKSHAYGKLSVFVSVKNKGGVG